MMGCMKVDSGGFEVVASRFVHGFDLLVGSHSDVHCYYVVHFRFSMLHVRLV